MVRRPRLIERLNQGLHGKLTLISAPAGFGKTTLVSEWITDCEGQVAWLSLDEGDSDPTRFLVYLIAALQTIAPDIGKSIEGLLQAPQAPPIESLLTALLNEIMTISGDFVLILDDYHILDNQSIDSGVAFLIEHLPPQMHLVITTREDPQLPLARLRVRGQLTEIRAADLRFTPAEAAGFLNQVMNLELSADDVAALEARTEGWIAGLQLAALSMQGQKDISHFIQSFTGTHHFVLDYLVEEVLHQQSEDIQAFLLYTSILDRMCGPLCDAVLQDDAYSGQQILEAIQQANLFLVPLDNERRWYRYHHLFGDLLRQRLHQRITSDEVNALHIRASQWYEENGFEVEAFQHAAAANDVERAERLIEGTGVPLYFRGVARPVLNWLESLPTDVLDARPSLWVTYASALTVTGQQINSAEDKLQAAESALQDAESDEQTRNLHGHIAAVRAMLAGPQYQIETMMAQSQRALELLSADNLPVRTMATWAMGLAYQYQGERAAARQAYTEAVSISQASGNIMVTIAALTCLGQMQEAENQLYLAQQSYQRVLEWVGDPPWPTACEAYLGLARLHYQWDVLDRAEEYAQRGLELGKQIENVDTPVACGALLAQIQLARGDLNGATSILVETEQFAQQHNFLNQMPLIIAEKVRILLRQGNVPAAAHLAKTYDLPISQARIYLAQEDYPAALTVLAAVRHHAEAKDWQDEQLQVIVLQAVAYAANDEMDNARQRLDEALELAAPGGFIRIFKDEGELMLKLLSEVSAHSVTPDYTRKLLAAFHAAAAPSQSPSSQPLVEPLSERELEILQLVAEGFSNREISEQLFLALSTVKGHNRNIFDKLQVKRRTEAIARARELGLL